MLKNEHLDDFDGCLTVRCDSIILKNFKIKAKTLTGKPYYLVVRDIMSALINDRLSIKPVKEPLKNEHFNDFDSRLIVKCNSTMLEEFKIKAQDSTGKSYFLLIRDIMAALIDDRLNIKPTEKQKNYGGLYNEY